MSPFVQILFACCISLLACGPSVESTEEGVASYYADFFQGQLTASGEIYDSTMLTAAHRKLAFGTSAIVTNLSNDKKVRVVINDRGPFVGNRIIDLSKAAAKELDFVKQGIVKVRIEVLSSD